MTLNGWQRIKYAYKKYEKSILNRCLLFVVALPVKSENVFVCASCNEYLATTMKWNQNKTLSRIRYMSLCVCARDRCIYREWRWHFKNDNEWTFFQEKRIQAKLTVISIWWNAAEGKQLRHNRQLKIPGKWNQRWKRHTQKYNNRSNFAIVAVVRRFVSTQHIDFLQCEGKKFDWKTTFQSESSGIILR